MAALAANRGGISVALIEPMNHAGGMYSNGLGQTDSLFKQYIGGLAAQYYLKVGAYYGEPSAPGYLFEPHVAEAIFNQMLSSSSVKVYLAQQLSSLSLNGQSIKSMILSGGLTVDSSAWIDASYEGDLLAAAGITYRVGREAISVYQEPHAGWARSTNMTGVWPFDSSGNLIPEVNPNPMEQKGAGDSKIMAYSYRCCTTTNTANMIPFPMPPGYDSQRYLGLSRSISNNNLTELSQIVTMSPTINYKYDLLRSENPFSVDLIGGGWLYPDASPQARLAIIQDHYNYVAGWLYFVSNDPSVPSGIQEELRTYGLAKDEFPDNNNWPHQLYIREGRRMIGQYVMTESDIVSNVSKPDVIAIGTWYGDCQPVDAYCSTDPDASTSGAQVAVDGELDVTAPAYQIPYGCLLPDPSQVTNLAVVCCPGSSHVGFSSLRVEPTFMMLGEAAGTAASLSVQNGDGFAGVSISTLQSTLASNGGILSL